MVMNKSKGKETEYEGRSVTRRKGGDSKRR